MGLGDFTILMGVLSGIFAQPTPILSDGGQRWKGWVQLATTSAFMSALSAFLLCYLNNDLMGNRSVMPFFVLNCAVCALACSVWTICLRLPNAR